MVDFGPDTDPHQAFIIQRQLNPPGQSPPFCSEFYISGSPSWGNSSNDGALQASTLREVLGYGGDTANVNLYMAHGGTSFGFWAGGWRGACGVVVLWWCCGRAGVLASTPWAPHGQVVGIAWLHISDGVIVRYIIVPLLCHYCAIIAFIAFIALCHYCASQME